MRWFYYTRRNDTISIYFNSFNGKQYSDNPKAISEYIHKVSPNIRIVWKARKEIWSQMPEYIFKVEHNTLKDLREQAQASVWVMNVPYPETGYFKGKKTLYIQTWHGDRGIKKIGWAAVDEMGRKYRGHKYLPYMDDCDIYVSGSDYGDMQARKGLCYKGKIVKAGMPKNDILVNSDRTGDYAIKVKKYLGIKKNTKILLYAPTFRDSNKNHQTCNVDIDSCLSHLRKRGDDWVCLVRAHSLVKDFAVQCKSDIIDVTNYQDMSDLLLMADCLITDYSSCAGDFVLTDKLCVLALFDKDDYMYNERALWVNPEKMGFLVAKNQEELDLILESNHNVRDINLKILGEYGTHETGKATEAVVKETLFWLNSLRENY